MKIVDFQIIEQCNRNCIFCCRPSLKNSKKLSLEIIKKKLVELSEDNYRTVVLTGGEPTLRNDLPEIIKFAKQHDITSVEMQSNGILLSNRDFVKKLSQAGLDVVHVAFPSHIKKTYSILTNSKNGFTKAIEGINNLLKFGITVQLVNVMNSLNYKELPDYVKFVRDDFINIYGINFLPIQPVKNAWKNRWIVPKFSDMIHFFYKTMEFLKENEMNFYVSEGMPLCFMENYEQYSAVTQLALKNVIIWDNFIKESNIINFKKVVTSDSSIHGKTDKCNPCTLKKICGGVWPQYLEIYGDDELQPSVRDLDRITSQIKKMIKG